MTGRLEICIVWIRLTNADESVRRDLRTKGRLGWLSRLIGFPRMTASGTRLIEPFDSLNAPFFSGGGGGTRAFSFVVVVGGRRSRGD